MEHFLKLATNNPDAIDITSFISKIYHTKYAIPSTKKRIAFYKRQQQNNSASLIAISLERTYGIYAVSIIINKDLSIKEISYKLHRGTDYLF